MLFAIDLMMAVFYLVNMALGSPYELTTQMVELNAEQNLPTWWSSVQLFLIGFILAAFAFRCARRDDRASWGLLVLPLPFMVMSLDEAARLHERLGHLGDVRAPGAAEVGLRFGARAIWTLVLTPVAICGIFFSGLCAKKYFAGRRKTLALFGIGMTLFIFFAVVLEVFFGAPESPTLRLAEGLVEETGEMVAGTILVWAAANFVSSHGFKLLAGPNDGSA